MAIPNTTIYVDETKTSDNENYIDNNAYEEIGELHADTGNAVVGRIDSRFSETKKTSVLSPNSNNILYTYFKKSNVKSWAVRKIKNNTYGIKERHIFVGENFLEVYDTETGNFINENPYILLSRLKNSRLAGGFGGRNVALDNDAAVKTLNESEYSSIIKNMFYTHYIENIDRFLVFSKISNELVIFTVNPDTLDVASYFPHIVYENIAKTKNNGISYLLGASPVVFDEDEPNIGLILNNDNLYVINFGKEELSENDIHKVFENGLDSYYIQDGLFGMCYRGNHNFTIVKELNQNASFNNSDLISSLKILTNIILNPVNLSVNIVVTENIQDNDGEQQNTIGGLLNTFTNKSSFFQVLKGDDKDEMSSSYSMYFIGSNYIAKIKGTNIVDNSGNPALQKVIYYAINDDVEIKHVFKNNQAVFAIASVSDEIALFSVIDDDGIHLERYSGENFIDFYKNLEVLTSIDDDKNSGYNFILGSYTEDGDIKPLIKTLTSSNFFSHGLEVESGINKTKGVSFGKTEIVHISIKPSEDRIENSDDIDSIDMTSNNDILDYGKEIWTKLKESGIPYNTHVRTVGRIIMDGKDIPIEYTLITRPNTNDVNGFGSVLFTFDKLFDINSIESKFVKLGNSLYPGILFKNNSGCFLNDAVISNVYSTDGSFGYNDSVSGKLFRSPITPNESDDLIKDYSLQLGITAQHIIKTVDNVYLVLSSGNCISSINIQTGGFTTYNGVDYGKDAPGIYGELPSRVDCITENAFKDLIFITQNGIYVKRNVDESSIEPSLLWEETDNTQVYKFGVTVKENTAFINYTVIESGEFASKIRIIDLNFTRNKNINFTPIITSKYEEKIGHRVYLTFTDDISNPTVTGILWINLFSKTIGILYKSEIESVDDILENVSYDKETSSFYSISKSGSIININSLSDVKSTVDISGYDGTIRYIFTRGSKLYLSTSKVSNSKETWNLYEVSNSIAEFKYSYDSDIVTSDAITLDGILNKIQFEIDGISEVTIRETDQDNELFLDNIEMHFGDIDVGKISAIFSIDKSFHFIANENDKVMMRSIYLRRNPSNNRFKDFQLSVSSFNENYNETLSVRKASEFITAIGFAGDGNLLVYTLNDGSIESIYLPLMEKYRSNFGESYLKEKVVSYNLSEVQEPQTTTIKGVIDDLFEVSQDDAEKGYEVVSYSFDSDISSENENEKTISSEDLTKHISEVENEYIYFLLKDKNEPYKNRAINRIFALPGEFLDEGARKIESVGSNVYFETTTKTLRWANDIGCFFKKTDEKYTGKNPLGKVLNNLNNTPVTPKPLVDAGKVSIGKYILYFGGYDPHATIESLTSHTAVNVYDTENDEYSVLYTGEDNLHGLLKARIRPFVFTINNYVYIFGGLERIDLLHDNTQYSRFRRTNSIERIDLESGEIFMLNATFGHKSYENFTDDGNVSFENTDFDMGVNEIPHLEFDSANYSLKGYIKTGSTEKDNSTLGRYVFNLGSNESVYSLDKPSSSFLGLKSNVKTSYDDFIVYHNGCVLSYANGDNGNKTVVLLDVGERDNSDHGIIISKIDTKIPQDSPQPKVKKILTPVTVSGKDIFGVITLDNRLHILVYDKEYFAYEIIKDLDSYTNDIQIDSSIFEPILQISDDEFVVDNTPIYCQSGNRVIYAYPHIKIEGALHNIGYRYNREGDAFYEFNSISNFVTKDSVDYMLKYSDYGIYVSAFDENHNEINKSNLISLNDVSQDITRDSYINAVLQQDDVIVFFYMNNAFVYLIDSNTLSYNSNIIDSNGSIISDFVYDKYNKCIYFISNDEEKTCLNIIRGTDRLSIEKNSTLSVISSHIDIIPYSSDTYEINSARITVYEDKVRVSYYTKGYCSSYFLKRNQNGDISNDEMTSFNIAYSTPIDFDTSKFLSLNPNDESLLIVNSDREFYYLSDINNKIAYKPIRLEFDNSWKIISNNNSSISLICGDAADEFDVTKSIDINPVKVTTNIGGYNIPISRLTSSSNVMMCESSDKVFVYSVVDSTNPNSNTVKIVSISKNKKEVNSWNIRLPFNPSQIKGIGYRDGSICFIKLGGNTTEINLSTFNLKEYNCGISSISDGTVVLTSYVDENSMYVYAQNVSNRFLAYYKGETYKSISITGNPNVYATGFKYIKENNSLVISGISNGGSNAIQNTIYYLNNDKQDDSGWIELDRSYNANPRNISNYLGKYVVPITVDSNSNIISPAGSFNKFDGSFTRKGIKNTGLEILEENIVNDEDSFSIKPLRAIACENKLITANTSSLDNITEQLTVTFSDYTAGNQILPVKYVPEIGKFNVSNNKTFFFNGKIYGYGLSSNNKGISVYNEMTKEFDIVDNSSDVECLVSAVSAHVTNTGKAYFIVIDRINSEIIAYNIKTNKIINRKPLYSNNETDAPLKGFYGNTDIIEIGKPLYYSHYAIFTYKTTTTNKRIASIDLDSIEKKSSLKNSDSVYCTDHIQDLTANAKLFSFNGFIFLSDNNNISEVYKNNYLHKSSNNEVITPISTTVGNSVEFITSGTRAVIPLLISNNNKGYYEVNDAEYLRFKSIKSKRDVAFSDKIANVVPLSDNKVMISKTSITEAENTTQGSDSYPLTVSLYESPVKNMKMNGFGVIIYSGSTADRFVSINLDTEDIISDIKVEREYGSYVKDIETYDKNHAVITYSGAMNVSTMIIDDEGNLTVKRYDGEVFGKKINTGSNIHTVQELDLVMMFDADMNNKLY